MVGYRSKEFTKNGKRKLVFNINDAVDDGEVTIACGQCVGCRLERSRQWAIRCVHEAQMHEQNVFLTFTYNEEHLPYPPSLDHRDFQLFMKRFRKKFPGRKISYYMCGEYGDENHRPHYHALIFGFDFPDKVFYKKSFNGDIYYISDTLNKIWKKGYVIIGQVTFESAAYVARYVMKKVTGDKAEEHYKCVDPETGELFDIEPEYNRMSLNPAVGKRWFDKYKADVYPSDFVVLNGRKLRPPKYYDNLLYDLNFEGEEGDRYDYDYIKFQRELKARVHDLEQTQERLFVKEKVKLAQINKLKRTL
jgi:hypothetical protein